MTMPDTQSETEKAGDAYVPCRIEDHCVVPCEALNDVAEIGGQGTRYQGVKSVSLVSMTTMKFARTLFVLKSGNHAKRGVFMNYCPFCGTAIIPDSASEGAEND